MTMAAAPQGPSTSVRGSLDVKAAVPAGANTCTTGSGAGGGDSSSSSSCSSMAAATATDAVDNKMEKGVGEGEDNSSSSGNGNSSDGAVLPVALGAPSVVGTSASSPSSSSSPPLPPQTTGDLNTKGKHENENGNGNDNDDGPGWDWDSDPANPYNWSSGKRWAQVGMAASFAILASLGTSILAPATTPLQQEFGVTLTQSIAPLSLYTFALALGPVLGGPLSETAGRYGTYVGLGTAGALFVLGAGLARGFAGLCVLRFLAGFCFGPSLAVSAGLVSDCFEPAARGLPSALFILTPFLGPGIAPLIGAFVVDRKGWRWTQWTMLFFYLEAMLVGLVFGRETYAPVLKARRAKKLNLPAPPSPPTWDKVKMFVTIALIRPVAMLCIEPIVTFICLYVSCEFATLFCFFASVPYVFKTVYGFSGEDVGLVYVAIVVGCVLGFLTVVACDVLVYRPQVPKHPPHRVPPEYRLAPALVGSLGIPLGIFWFGWTARPGVSWASAAVAIAPFAWGNLCLFVSTMQYLVDTYQRTTVASAASANSLARYGLAGAFPLFTVQMYERLGVGWASSLLGFLAVALLPVPWVLYKYGRQIRAKSRYETATW